MAAGFSIQNSASSGERRVNVEFPFTRGRRTVNLPAASLMKMESLPVSPSGGRRNYFAAATLTLGFVAVVLANAGCGTVKPSASGKNPPPGFVSVFNGRDFTGWAGPVENYEVKDGAMVCRPAKGGTIFTQQEFTNFTVRLEFKLPPGGNNGLAIRYPGTGDTAYTGMCECQVLDENFESATGQTIDPRQAHGSAYGMVAARRGFQKPIGEWNFEQVTVRGSTIKVELNGMVILDADLSRVTEFLANHPHPGKDRVSGHFGFAGHNDPVKFRNIFIKPLNKKNSPQ